jgi:hypothetical protein
MGLLTSCGQSLILPTSDDNAAKPWLFESMVTAIAEGLSGGLPMGEGDGAFTPV